MLWKKNKDAVRPAKKKDLERIGELRRQAHELHQTGRPDVFQKPFGDALGAETRRMFYDKNGLLLVTETDGTVCGFVYAAFVTEPATPVWDSRSYCNIEEIAVDKSCRGHSYGTQLMQAVRREVVARGCPKLELNVWAFNGPAMHFYEELGMKPRSVSMEMRLDAEEKEEA